jgi:hypothetical protein
MSITAIAHQAQGIRAGEVIAKLAEDASCESTTGSPSRPRQEPRQRSYKS